MRFSSFLACAIIPGICGFFSGCEEAQTAPSGQSSGEAVDGTPLPAEISFNEHIQPILSEYCYHCHGPDSGTREPKDMPLRLDVPEDALAKRGDHSPVIIPGKPEESEIIRLMQSTDRDVIMPPPSSHKVMKPREIALMEEWVRQGAEYEAHWSFVPIEKPEPPATDDDGWAKNPVDQFVISKLQDNKLSPNPEESARRFHRRMTLDLTGLPPDPKDTDRFEKEYLERGDAAVEAEADRLLASTACAEHFARHWLDAARYADTHGIHIDNYRAIWPYRDWVVRAFRDNLPWDQFTLEQIAGDLIPDRSLDQLVATGFSRCLATTGEGGAIPEEYEAIYAKDRVDTVSAIWLGLTTGCASCHDHKFDPISTKEFYSLAAFFRNTTMQAMDRNNAEHPPNVFVPLPADREEWNQIEEKIQAANQELENRRSSGSEEWKEWEKDPEFHFPRDNDPSLELELSFNQESGPLNGFIGKQPHEWSVEIPRIDGPLGKAPLISETPVDLGDLAGFSREDQVTLGGYFRIEKPTAGTLIGRVDPTDNFRGWELSLDNTKPVFLVCDQWDKAATKVVANRKLKPGQWHHIMVTFNGKVGGHQAVTLYIDGKKANGGTNPNTVGGNIESNASLRVGGRQGEDPKFSGNVAIQDFRFYRRLLSPKEIAQLPEIVRYSQIAAIPATERNPEQTKALKEYYYTHIDEATLAILEKRSELEKQKKSMRDRGSVSLVMEEKDTEPFAHVLARGVYSDKGEKVPPATPAVLPPMPEDAPKNRLGLALWLNDPANPLPARVTMNRAWYTFFGTGIVESNSDFGIMGARPSHPKLLDWLAAEFIASDWNYRHMVKLIVTSATYRQSGRVNAEKLEKDPFNRLLSRGPRIRLDAEPIRDLALAASGLLSGQIGGPPVKPYQPEGIWSAVAMPQSNTRNYKQDSGEGLYRRSLYWFWKRTAPPATLEIFNAPTREVFCVRRDLTNTPLQALALMNDPQFVEASRVLATRAIEYSEDPAERIDFITRRLINRTLDETEMPVALRSLDEFETVYREDPEAATKLVQVGETPAPDSIDTAELATWTMVTSQILNLDETITR